MRLRRRACRVNSKTTLRFCGSTAAVLEVVVWPVVVATALVVVFASSLSPHPAATNANVAGTNTNRAGDVVTSHHEVTTNRRQGVEHDVLNLDEEQPPLPRNGQVRV